MTIHLLLPPPPCPPYPCPTFPSCQKLLDLADAAQLKGKIEAMFSGEHINSTEDRAVLHVATRARRDQVGWAPGGGRVRLGGGSSLSHTGSIQRVGG